MWIEKVKGEWWLLPGKAYVRREGPAIYAARICKHGVWLPVRNPNLERYSFIFPHTAMRAADKDLTDEN